MEANVLIALALSFLGLIVWVGLYVFSVLHIMRSDPREIEFRTDAGDSMDFLPKTINKKT